VAPEADTLLEGLKEETGLYRKLLSVSSDELRLVKDAELEKATSLISEKQTILDSIAVVEQRIKPSKERWPEIKAALPAGRQSEFQAALKDLSDVLERLIGLERETEDTLSGQIRTIKGAGRRMPAGSTEEQARRAYGAQKEAKR